MVIRDDGGTPRGRGRPQKPVLTRERITTAALKLVSKRGHQAFTLDALAKDLKVSASALYNHASSKATVFLWMQDAINATIDTAAFESASTDDALVAWARSYRDAYADFPMLVPMMAVQPIANAPATMAMYDRVVRGLVAGGYAERDALNIIVAVEAFVFGAALDLSAPADIFDPGMHADDVPALAQAIAQRRESHGEGREAADAAFETGLTAILCGLRARRDG